MAARSREIDTAVARCEPPLNVPYVAIVPVRMLESWLLIDESAMRRAAGNPNGERPLALPPARGLEGIHNPKELLRDLILDASEMHGRRLNKVKASPAVVSAYIEDFSPLRALRAFRAFETKLRAALDRR
jgi:hypothetical protein